jgi:hypothetical protein
VREEVHVREVLPLGLDMDDAVIRRRLQMKTEFLTESSAKATEPDEATLEAHPVANAYWLPEPPLLAFEHVLRGAAQAARFLWPLPLWPTVPLAHRRRVAAIRKPDRHIGRRLGPSAGQPLRKVDSEALPPDSTIAPGPSERRAPAGSSGGAA